MKKQKEKIEMRIDSYRNCKCGLCEARIHELKWILNLLEKKKKTKLEEDPSIVLEEKK